MSKLGTKITYYEKFEYSHSTQTEMTCVNRLEIICHGKP